MIDRVVYEINQEENRISLKVSIHPRFVHKEEVTFFDNESAEKILLDNGLKYDIMVSCPKSILSNKNKGSTTQGEWVFSRKKTKVAAKRTRTKTRTAQTTSSPKRED